MSSEWMQTTLGSVCERQNGSIQTGPFGSQLHASDYKELGIPVVMPANIGDGGIEEEGIARIDTSDVERLSQHKLKIGDIVFSRRGDVTRSALVRPHEEGWLCGTGCLKVRTGDQSSATAQFISYSLRLPETKAWLVRHAVGATMPNLNTSILSAVPLKLPPLSQQEAISGFLGCLDERIALLRETNATLEAIAQALFKSWFIDFEPVRVKSEGRDPEELSTEVAGLFPHEFEESEIGLVPKGWCVQAVYDMAQYINGAAYKAFEPNSERQGLPIIKIAELKAGVTPQTKFSDVEMPGKYLIEQKDILFSWSGNPDTSIGTFVWSHGNAWLNQHIFKVVPKSPMARSFVLLALRHLKPVFTEMARNKQTTGLGHVTVADMKALRIAMPSFPVLQNWSELADPLVEQAFVVRQKIQALADLRDALLPRLISGQLRLPEADALLQDAA